MANSIVLANIPEITIKGVSLALVITTITYFVTVAIYRLTLHPLARFPGPKLYAISALPTVVSMLRGRMPMDQRVLHDKYGPVVRVAPDELVFNSEAAWDDIYALKTSPKINMPKDPKHAGSVAPLPNATTITMADEANHARLRRILAYGFSEHALRQQEGIIHGYIELILQRLTNFAKTGETFNLADWLSFSTFDIIGDLAFGAPFGCLEKGEYHWWVGLLFQNLKVGVLIQATRRICKQDSWMQRMMMAMIPSSIRELQKKHLAYSQATITKRLENPESQRKDFVYYILRQREKHGLNDNELILNSAFLIIAGSETTASLMSAFFAMMMHYPDAYDKVREEVRARFASADEISYDTAQLPYLNACIEETLRMVPPVAAGLLRTVPTGGDMVDGHWVPEGTTVSVGSWAASHNSDSFVECDQFLPERWLDNAGDFYSTDNRRGMQPFLLGPRSCIGRNLAYIESRLMLSQLLWHFDFTSPDGAWQWGPKGTMENLRVYHTLEKPVLNVKATLRA